jgi:hypothetical protein
MLTYYNPRVVCSTRLTRLFVDVWLTLHLNRDATRSLSSSDSSFRPCIFTSFLVRIIMPRLPIISLLFFMAVSAPNIVLADRGTVRASSESRYSRAHSLGDSYSFNPRDGWQSVNATNLQYKYRRSYEVAPGLETPDLENKEVVARGSKSQKKDSTIGGTVKGVIDDVWKGLKAIGQPEDVIVTW